MMQQILSNPYFTLPLTLGIYLGAQWFYRRVHFPLFHPLLVTIGLLIGLLLTFSVPYESYEKGSHLLSFLLGPSVQRECPPQGACCFHSHLCFCGGGSGDCKRRSHRLPIWSR